MENCARTLLDGLIDYAALFPPAELPMDEAFARFLGHRSGAAGWMLARFVCPAARLDELAPMLESAGDDGGVVRLAVLGRGGDTLEDFLAGTKADAAALEAFVEAHPNVRADVFEARLPAAGGAAVAVNDASLMLARAGITPFFETGVLGEWRQLLPAAAAAVRDADRQAGDGRRVGLKIRCGGLDAAAVPEPMAVAAAIAIGRSVGVPLKATQGLHHPFRHHDPDLATEVHGFLNLYIAAALAFSHDLPVTHLTEIIAETDRQAFILGDDTIGWRDFTVSAAEIASARAGLLTTFGSCSFTEPRDDLRELGLID